MANAYGSYTQVGSGFNSASNASFTLVGTIDLTASPPHELFLIASAKVGTGGATEYVNIWVSGSLDGTTYSDAPSSTTKLNARFVGAINTQTSATQAIMAPTAVSPLFGGALPRYLKVYAENATGYALSAADNWVYYQTETFG
ncbi:MAG: hypothetical protein IT502_01950 [Rubrivivax sp.]|nr:hypothetical protein [Rubrivivax sp.]